MKLVVNKCYGGFSVSHEAIMRYGELKGYDVVLYTRDDDTEADFAVYRRITDEEFETLSLWEIMYVVNPPEGETFELHYDDPDLVEFLSTYDFEKRRAEPEFIQVVEELGTRANGRFANLRLVEIPDGAEWNISDYDGLETVHYGFQLGEI